MPQQLDETHKLYMYIVQTSSTRHQLKSYLLSCVITVISHSTRPRMAPKPGPNSPCSRWCSGPSFVQPVEQGVEIHLLAALGHPLGHVQHLVPRISHGDCLLNHFSIGMATHHMRPWMAHATTWGDLWWLDCWRAARRVAVTCTVALRIALWCELCRTTSIGPFAWRWPIGTLT